jgi:hypothetical protein
MGVSNYYEVEDRELKEEAFYVLCEEDRFVDIITLKLKEMYLETYDVILEESYQYINDLLPSFAKFTDRFIKDEQSVHKIVTRLRKTLKPKKTKEE